MCSQYTGTRMFHVYKCQNLDITYSKPICRIISDYSTSTYEFENHYCNVDLNIYKMLLNVHISALFQCAVALTCLKQIFVTYPRRYQINPELYPNCQTLTLTI